MKLTKQLAKKLLGIKGEARGLLLRDDLRFVLKEKGEEGIEKVEKELEKLGYPLDYKKIETFRFYPVGLRVLSLLAIKQAFNWKDSQIKGMCRAATGGSIILKSYTKFFGSQISAIKVGPKLYHAYFTVGKMEISEYDPEKKVTVLELTKELTFHSILCLCTEGYFEGLIKMVTGAKKIKCKEIKCVLKGDDCHQFEITWQ